MRPAFYTAPPQPKASVEWDDVAPVRGMDGTVPIHNMPPGTAIFLYNIIPSEYGCQTRPGYRTWAQNLAGGAVKSLLPFLGTLGDASTSRLFAANSTGIYNVTSQGTDNPVAAVTFPSTINRAGFCSHIHFTDPTGAQVLLVADGENGMYEYDPVGATWTKYTTEITFPGTVTPADIVFITVHKGRIWLIAKDSADAYYLPVGAKNGVATLFQFGSKMEHGGYLVGLWTWSHDGGNGIDDYLIVYGKGGDVLVYQGTDPSQADRWSLVGRWFVGTPPEGRRVVVEVGGDTLILSAFGVTSATALLQGVDPTRVERNVTGKITRLVRDAIKVKSDLDYWEMQLLPEEGLLSINSPRRTNERHIQFMLNLNRVSEDSGGGWGLWRDVPANVFENFNRRIFLGTEAGTVEILQDSLDAVDINGVGGTPVGFSGLTRFTHYAHPALYKQVGFIRPQFITSNVVSVASKAVYDYQLGELNLLPIIGGAQFSKWDSALWDRALWSGTFSAFTLSGGSGYGREIGIFFQGEAFARATLASFEGTYSPWAFL